MARGLPLLLACALAAAACGGTTPAEDDPAATAPAASATSTPPPTSPPPPSPTTSPVPEGAFLVEPDREPQELEPADLAPEGTEPTGAWFGTAGGADVAVVAVAGEGDVFARDRALFRWVRRPDLGAWVGLEIARYPARRGVLSIDVVVADVTGDEHDDALVFALTGGSGACGTWSVLDLVTDARLFSRSLCDAQVDPLGEPAGLRVTEAVYRVGDPHCCPSARRETELAYTGTDWEVVRRELTRLD